MCRFNTWPKVQAPLTYDPLMKSSADLPSEDTQATQDNQFSPLSEDEE